MANKHVLNPCNNSNVPVPTQYMENVASNLNGVLKAYCSACNTENVTVSKKTLAYRKHGHGDQA